MSFCEIEEQMELPELKKLYSYMKDYELAARILNMLWVNFSEDHCDTCLCVSEGNVNRFKNWLQSGSPDDAWS